MSYFDDPLITIHQQAPSRLIRVDASTDVQTEAFPEFAEEGYVEFTPEVSTAAVYIFAHPNLPYCCTHSLGVSSSTTTLSARFFGGGKIEDFVSPASPGSVVGRTFNLDGTDGRESIFLPGTTFIELSVANTGAPIGKISIWSQ